MPRIFKKEVGKVVEDPQIKKEIDARISLIKKLSDFKKLKEKDRTTRTEKKLLFFAKLGWPVTLPLALILGIIGATYIGVSYLGKIAKEKYNKSIYADSDAWKLRQALTSLDPNVSFQKLYQAQENKPAVKETLKKNNCLLKSIARFFKNKFSYRYHWEDKQPELKGNSLLVLALKNRKLEDAKFIIKEGIFNNVSKNVLKAYESISVLTEEEKLEIFQLLSENAQRKEDLEVLVDYLKKSGREAFSKQLVEKGLTHFHTDIQLRCKMLATSFGDLQLFEKAFGIKLSEEIIKDKAKLNEVIRNFYKNNFEQFDQIQEFIMHDACKSDNPLIVQFLSQAVYVYNMRQEKSLRGLIDNMRRGILFGETIDDLDYFGKTIQRRLPDFGLKAFSKAIDKYKKTNGLDTDSQDLIIKTLEEAEKRLHPLANPFVMSGKNGVEPRHLMSMKLANELDKLNGLKGNQRGSFSNMVGFYQHMRRKIAWTRYVPGGLTGKFSAAVLATYVLETFPNTNAYSTFFIINIPLYALLFAGMGISHGFVKWYREKEAKGLGIDISLHQFETKLQANLDEAFELGPSTPLSPRPKGKKVAQKGFASKIPEKQLAQAMKLGSLPSVLNILLSSDQLKLKDHFEEIMKNFDNLHYFYLDESVHRELKYFGRIDLNQNFKPFIVQKICENLTPQQMYLFLKHQLELGDKETVEVVIRELGHSIFNKKKPLAPFDRNQFQMCILLSAQLGNPNVLKEFVEAGDELLEENWMIKTKDPKTGDSLLHLACQTRDVQSIVYVAGKLGPTAFKLKNKEGKTIQEMIDKDLAQQLDQVFKFNPEWSGSFTKLYEMRTAKHTHELTMEVIAVLPAKAMINLAVSAAMHTILHKASIAAEGLSPGASLLVVSSVEFAVGLCVMLVGFAIGIIGGKGLGAAYSQAQNYRKGYDDAIVQLALEDEKTPLEYVESRFKYALEYAERMRSLTKSTSDVLQKALSRAIEKRKNLFNPIIQSEFEKLQQELPEIIKENVNALVAQKKLAERMRAFLTPKQLELMIPTIYEELGEILEAHQQISL